MTSVILKLFDKNVNYSIYIPIRKIKKQKHFALVAGVYCPGCREFPVQEESFRKGIWFM